MIPMIHHRLLVSRAIRCTNVNVHVHVNAHVHARSSARVLRLGSNRSSSSSKGEPKSWWTDPVLWGKLTAISGWTMSLAAIYDSFNQGPEVISLPMTCVLTGYSSLFVRWAFVVKPQNLFLASCHLTNVCAQLNQLRRGLQYKIDNGQQDQVTDLAQKAGTVGAVSAVAIVSGPHLQKILSSAKFGAVSRVAQSEAGPFRVHFWAPASKWLISGASLMELDRPTDTISLPQYAALTLCGVIHARYALTVVPINYMLCSVNIALFGSSFWHLGRKTKADYIDVVPGDEKSTASTTTQGSSPAAATPNNNQLTRKDTAPWHADGIQKTESEA